LIIFIILKRKVISGNLKELDEPPAEPEATVFGEKGMKGFIEERAPKSSGEEGM
jgi:hypothetical protein